jgi:hypothetical protein
MTGSRPAPVGVVALLVDTNKAGENHVAGSVISLCVDQKSEHNCSNVTLLPSPESASRARVFAKDRRVDFAGGSGGPIEAGHALGDLRGRGWRRPAGAEASRCRNTLVLGGRIWMCETGQADVGGDRVRQRQLKRGAGMRLRSLAVAGVAATAIVTGVAACGGSSSTTASSSSTVALNGEQDKTANQILADSRAAVATATSMRFVGTDPESSPPFGIDLYVGPNKTATGSIRMDGQTVEITRMGSDFYIKGSEAFYTKSAGVPVSVARLFAGRWVKVPATGADVGDFDKLTDLKTFSAEVLTPTHTVTKAGQGTVRGTQVIYLDDGTEDKVAISLEGKPYPLAFTSSANTIPIANITWDTPMTVTAPAGAIDFSKVAG